MEKKKEFTIISNQLIEKLATEKLSALGYKIIFILINEITRWENSKKKVEYLSLYKIIKLTKANHQRIRMELTELKEKGLLDFDKQEGGYKVYPVQYDRVQSVPPDGVQSVRVQSVKVYPIDPDKTLDVQGVTEPEINSLNKEEINNKKDKNPVAGKEEKVKYDELPFTNEPDKLIEHAKKELELDIMYIVKYAKKTKYFKTLPKTRIKEYVDLYGKRIVIRAMETVENRKDKPNSPLGLLNVIMEKMAETPEDLWDKPQSSHEVPNKLSWSDVEKALNEARTVRDNLMDSIAGVDEATLKRVTKELANSIKGNPKQYPKGLNGDYTAYIRDHLNGFEALFETPPGSVGEKEKIKMSLIRYKNLIYEYQRIL